MPTRRHRLLLVLLLIANDAPASFAQQSAAGQDTLIGIVGRDFVMMGADSSSSGGGGIALTSSNVDKIALVHDGRRRRRSTSAANDEEDDGDDARMMRRRLEDFFRSSSEQQAIAVGFAGDAADADRLVGMLKTHAQVREYEAGIGNDVSCVFDGGSGGASKISGIKSSEALSTAGMDAEAIAYLSRNEISSRMRSRQPLQLCLLVGGMVRCNGNADGASSEAKANAVGRVQKQISTGSAAYVPKGENDATGESERIIRTMETYSGSSGSRSPTLNWGDRTTSNPFLVPRLFWLDQYGSMQNMRYAAHGFGSNFAYSILDQRYRGAMSRQEAADLIQECFEQLRQRYVINSPRPPRIKCIDQFGVTEAIEADIER